MTDSKTPEWVVEQATELADEVFDACIDSYEGHDGADYTSLISQALLSAYERGRKEGIEEVAKVAASGKIYAHVTTGEQPTVRPIEHRDLIATAIRQLLEVKG